MVQRRMPVVLHTTTSSRENFNLKFKVQVEVFDSLDSQATT